MVLIGLNGTENAGKERTGVYMKGEDTRRGEDRIGLEEKRGQDRFRRKERTGYV